MPARISPGNESQIVRLYLQGVSQSKISQEMHVSQSTVSQAILRYKKDTKQTSITTASTKAGVADTVEQLRSLSANLTRAGITVDEANRACELKQELDRIGIDFHTLSQLLAVCRRITPTDFPISDFVQAIIQMARIEKAFNKTYQEIVSEYEEKHTQLNTLNTEIKKANDSLTQTTRRENEERANLNRRIQEAQTTLEKVDRSLKFGQELERAGLTLEKGEAAGNILRLFSDLIESKGLTPKDAITKLEGFLSNAKSLEEATNNLKKQANELNTKQELLAAEVHTLEAHKNKLTLENRFLEKATEAVEELMERHEMRVEDITKIRDLAQKYGPPSSILKALETYKSSTEIEEQRTAREAAVKELTKEEGSLRVKIETFEKRLEALPAEVDASISGVKSSLDSFSLQLQGLGAATARASGEIDSLKEKSLAAGRDIAAIESRVKAYKFTSKLIDFIVDGKGEESDIATVAVSFLNHLSEWVNSQRKYSDTRQQIETLRDHIERQLILG